MKPWILLKRWILYVLITIVTAAGITANIADRDRDTKPTAAGITANVADRDRGGNPNRNRNGDTKHTATLKMKSRKLSKRTAKLRHNKNKNRKKQMADIKKANKQRNKKMKNK